MAINPYLESFENWIDENNLQDWNFITQDSTREDTVFTLSRESSIVYNGTYSAKVQIDTGADSGTAYAELNHWDSIHDSNDNYFILGDTITLYKYAKTVPFYYDMEIDLWIYDSNGDYVTKRIIGDFLEKNPDTDWVQVQYDTSTWNGYRGFLVISMEAYIASSTFEFYFDYITTIEPPETFEGNDTITLSDNLFTNLSQEKAILNDIINLSDLQEDNHLNLNEPIYLSDELATQQEFVDEDTINISDKEDLKLNINIGDSITVSELGNPYISPKFASRLIFDSNNNRLLLTTDDEAVQLIDIDISGVTPDYTVYSYDAIGENYNYANDLVKDNFNNYIYIGCNNGLIIEIDATNLSIRTEIDLSDTSNIDNLIFINERGILFGMTNQNDAELYEIYSGSSKIIDTDFRFLTRETDELETDFNYILGKKLDTDFRFLAETTKQISTDFRYLKNSYEDETITPRYGSGFLVKIDDIEATDVDLANINIRLNEGEKQDADFILARFHDKLNYTTENTYQEIDNQNEVKIYINDNLVFTGTIYKIEALGSSERVKVYARGAEVETDINVVDLPLAGFNEQRHQYHVILDDIEIENPVIDSNEENPIYYLGTKVSLGNLERERIVQYGLLPPNTPNTYIRWIFDSFDETTTQAKIGNIYLSPEEWQDFQPKQNYTYFWFVSGTKIDITRDASGNLISQAIEFEWAYIGTSLAQLNGDLYNITGVYGIYQREFDNDTSFLGFYSVGSAPYKDISTENGKYMPAVKWVDRPDGLYLVRESGDSKVVYAKAVANAEYEKMLNINGNILPKTEATITIPIDGYLFYNLQVLNRINLVNTVESDIYKNNNGFPVAIKQIHISSATMTVTLETDNYKSIAEMDEIDNSIQVYNISTGVDKKLVRKFDLNTLKYID